MSIAEVQARMASITARFAVPTQPATGAAFADELAKAQSSSSRSTSVQSAAAGTTGATGTAAVVIADAKRYLGVPYVWGGTNPATGLDCSGLTQLVYGHAGVDLPRVSWEQAKTGTPVDGLANARPGDLLFFDSPVDHVAIYLGGNQMIHAPKPGRSVEISDVYETPSVIRRVLPDAEPGSASTSAAYPTSASTSAAYPTSASTSAAYPAGYPTLAALQSLGGTLS